MQILPDKFKKNLFEHLESHAFYWLQRIIKLNFLFILFSIAYLSDYKKLISSYFIIIPFFRRLFLATFKIMTNLQFWTSLLSTIRYSFTVDFTRSSHLSIRDSRFQMPQWRNFLSVVSTRLCAVCKNILELLKSLTGCHSLYIFFDVFFFTFSSWMILFSNISLNT